MIRTILVDDEQRGLNSLKKMLELDCPEVEVIAECQDASTARKKIETLQPDLVFLDIAMPEKSGMEMLAEIPHINFEIIFVTAHNSYTIQAFRYSAIDYLLKPVDEDLLIEAVNKAKRRIQSNHLNDNIEVLLHNMQARHPEKEMKLCIPSLKGFEVLELRDIIYCEAESSYTIFHLVNKNPVTVSKSLIDYEEILDGTTFFRIHKSFLVNLQHIKEYHRGEGGSVIMTNGKEIEVSRRKKENFLARVKEVFRY